MLLSGGDGKHGLLRYGCTRSCRAPLASAGRLFPRGQQSIYRASSTYRTVLHLPTVIVAAEGSSSSKKNSASSAPLYYQRQHGSILGSTAPCNVVFF